VRILSITAGAAGMYCGSCLRDNALAAELLARGHDVTLLPLYTPTRTDEPNVSRRRVLFGGLNVYLQQQSSLFRRVSPLFDWLLDRPGVISAFADRSSSTDPRTLGDLTISMLEGRDGVLAREFGKLITWLASEPRPDIVNLPNSLLIGLARPLAEALERPVCCTLQGEDLFLNGLSPAYRDRAIDLIQREVKYVDTFIAVSEFCAASMSQWLKIPADRVAVVPLGVNATEYDGRSTRHEGHEGEGQRGGQDVFRVGYLARVAPEKGLHLLAEAFQRFRQRNPKSQLRLEAAGYLAPAHRPYLLDIQRSLKRAGLDSAFSYRGALDLSAKVAFLRTIDVLSVPATYDDPKGIFLLEAMATGVPVVQPRRGAFIEVIEKTGGGLLVEPDDPESLAIGLESLLRDRVLREQLGRRAFDGVRQHYTVQRSADRLMAVYSELAGRTGQDLSLASR
jgi:glycosyltransferase involved in cell wall biosynthesis